MIVVCLRHHRLDVPANGIDRVLGLGCQEEDRVGEVKESAFGARRRLLARIANCWRVHSLPTGNIALARMWMLNHSDPPEQ